jgi:hypothetical protein
VSGQAAEVAHIRHDAIQAAVNNGVAFSVAAGNSHINASGVVPASFDNIITVSEHARPPRAR